MESFGCFYNFRKRKVLRKTIGIFEAKICKKQVIKGREFAYFEVLRISQLNL